MGEGTAHLPAFSRLEYDPSHGWQVEENDHPIEEVRLTVDPFDNPKLPALTFRTWLLGVSSCVLLSFINQFFGFRKNLLSIGSVCIQIVTLPLGRLLARTLPKKDIKLLFTNWSFSLNPGPFTIKEHCLITLFAGTGASGIYSIHIITIVKAFYHKKINLMAAFLLAHTSQLLGYGWAGIFRKYLVESPYMWWPANLINVSLFKALHQKENRKKGTLTRFQFFIIVFIASFAYYVIPGFIFPAISAISFLCFIYKNSVTMHQIGSGLNGIGIGSFGLDWSTVVSFLGSPLATPSIAIFNIMISFFLRVYLLLPLTYWTNTYNSKRFPIISSDVFDNSGNIYNISRIINVRTFTLNVQEQENYSKINTSIIFSFGYGLNFAALTATIMHVALYNGRDIWKMWKNTREYSMDMIDDVHTRLMKRNYEPVPQWWFHVLLVSIVGLSIFTCLGFNRQLQLPWWGVFFACAMAFFFTLPFGVIQATTNQGVGLYVITEYLMGLILPGKPLANVTFKTYGSISLVHALALLKDLNLGHYMKIPPKSMFIVQLIGTIIATCIHFATAWFLLNSIRNICDTSKLPPGSPWTCPADNIQFTISIIWGLVGPERIFGKLGHYSLLNYFFLIGFLLPIPFWLLTKAFPEKRWLKNIHIPLLISGANAIPPAHAVNYTMWGAFGIFFNYYIYKRHKNWWARHTYVMSAALDAGVAFMGVLLFFALQLKNIYGIDWWGGVGNDYCPLASCPTSPEVVVKGCPIMQ